MVFAFLHEYSLSYDRSLSLFSSLRVRQTLDANLGNVHQQPGHPAALSSIRLEVYASIGQHKSETDA